MNEWVIFFINYLLYCVNNLFSVIAGIYLLTPKCSRLKAIVISYACVNVGGTIKFFMPLGTRYDMAFACINIVTWIVVTYLLCEDNMFSCLLYFGCVNMICVLSMLMWLVTPYAEASNWEIGTTIGYLISTPVAIAGFFIIIWGKEKLFKRKDFEISGRTAIFVLLIGVYYAMFSYIPMMFEANVNTDREHVVFIMDVVGIFVYVIILYMILKKSEEIRYYKRSKELELARVKEQEIYDGLIGRMEHMEKIRHDFYGQLAVARHIVNQDREKGLQMIEELEWQLGSFSFEPENTKVGGIVG